MTGLDLAEGERLLAEATPRPWRARPHSQRSWKSPKRSYRYVEFDRDGYTTSALEPDDATLIVWLVNHADALLQAAKERDALREALASALTGTERPPEHVFEEFRRLHGIAEP